MALGSVFDEREIDNHLAGVCGMYCGMCPVYRAWVEQREADLSRFAQERRVPVARILCTGCRSPASYCLGGDCEIKECAEEKGVVFCADCDEFPCEKTNRLVARAPHLEEAVRNSYRIREVGWYEWLREQDVRWRCPGCGAKVGYAAIACRACGRGSTGRPATAASRWTDRTISLR